MQRWVYTFGDDIGDRDPKQLLGGKGAGLAEMTRLEIPVPPGFTITTQACRAYVDAGGEMPDGLEAEVEEHVRRLEETIGRKLGDRSTPLLVSVRSGAAVSMPGMMDTILNLGLTDDTVEGLAASSGDRRFAFDAYRRLLEMYGDVVLEVPREKFEAAFTQVKKSLGNPSMSDQEVPEEQLVELVSRSKEIVAESTGKPFPSDVRDQLWGAIGAVFRSWDNPRANRYRKMHGIPHTMGTAVNVQAMVFGNMGDDSGSGVCFTRSPATGEKVLYGEFLANAQGEDVVAGIRTPRPMTAAASSPGREKESLERYMPDAYREILEMATKLEQHFREMQDIEFTIEKSRVFILQTRTGKRTAHAAVKIAVDMVAEGLLDRDQAVLRVDPESLEQLLHDRLPEPEVLEKRGIVAIAAGLPASPGAAMGEIVLDADEAEAKANEGKHVVLVRRETSPEDIHGMKAAQGIVTATGGMTCIAGDTRVLTDRGMMTAHDAFGAVERGESLRLLSFDAQKMRAVFRDVIAAGRRPAEVIEVAVSQTGRSEENVLRLTADHKLLTIERRKLRKKPLDEVLRDGDFALVADRLPALGLTASSPELGYVAGALFSDGYVMVKPTKGSVTFVQKPTPEKAEFIAAVEHAFERTFGVPFSYVRQRETVATLRGREIRGSVEDRICYRREPAARLAAIRDDLPRWILSLDEPILLRFLAGFVDGDGTYATESSEVRLQVTVSQNKPGLLEGLVLACLRLGIVPQVTNNRDSHLVQISERAADIVAVGHRVTPDIRARIYESKCLSVRALFEDIVDQVNFMGRVREGIKRNLMFGVEKIRRDVLPLCDADAYREVEALLGSSLRSYRIKQVGGPTPSDVYNFEVDARDEIDKCFVVFSSRLTPVLVSNSHAAVVARGLGKCCVAGVSAMQVDYESRKVTVRTEDGRRIELSPGDKITLDGTHGKIYEGELDVEAAAKVPEFEALMEWADARRRMRVRANADTPRAAKQARSYGAEGIGLCRTEHMFFAEDRLEAVRCMALAESTDERAEWLERIEPMQREDFTAIFEAMKGLPVTIRLLDWPLHEFLPREERELQQVAKALGVDAATVRKRAADMREVNPMLGHRGVRVGLTTPEIYRMQTRAIVAAAADCAARGVKVQPEIMIPVVALAEELAAMREIVEQAARAALEGKEGAVTFQIGTMIELPRACLVAAELAKTAEFFSFGTNDLTQTTFGISRDDAGRFLAHYVDKRGLLPADPFAKLDQDGVGELVRTGTERGRKGRPGLKVGVCGEHGGDPSSIAFCDRIGLDYVSCSPPRLPIARLAAAQATIRNRS